MPKISALVEKINFKNRVALTVAVFALSASFILLALYQQNNAGTASANSVVTAGVPSVTSTVPSQNAYGVTAGSSVTVNFSEAVDQSTVNSSTFRVISNQTGVHSAGTFNFTNGDTTVEFVPTNSLDQAGEKVTVILTTGIQSSSTSQALDDFYVYQFTIATTGGTNAFERISTTKFNNDQGLSPRPSDHIIADLTGDGDLDLAFSNLNEGLETWVGDGDGTISSPQNIVTSVPGIQGRALLTAPMDNNDSMDLVFKRSQNALEVHLNDGSGNFSSTMTVNRMGNTVDLGPIGLGDFDGDGDIDVVEGHYFNSNVLVFLNNGGTSLDYSATYVVGSGTPVGGFEVGDFDGDYDLDITNGNYVLTNNGSGVFSISAAQGGISGSVRSMVLDRFIPGDTFLHRIQSMSGSNLSFLDNDGTGTFTFSSLAGSHNLGSTDGLASGDFDGDGDPDLVAAQPFPTSGKIQVLENTSVGSPSFSPPFSPQYARQENETLEVGDLNNDGVLDLVSSVDDSGGADLPGFSIWLGLASVADEFTGGEMTFLGGSDRDGSGDPGGTFVISQQIDDKWQVVHQRSFDVEYSTQQMEIIPDGRTVKLRIVQETIPFADVDRIQLRACGKDLTPQYAIYTENGQDLSYDLAEVDHNVVIAHEKTIEISWKTPFFCAENALLSLTANEYGHASHLSYPQGDEGMTYNLNSNYRSINVDGYLTETDEMQTASYEAFWQPVTGHPDGYTYIYVSNDDSSLNVALDITMDNTDEVGEDWAELVFDHPSGEKTYRIDDYDDTYGKCGFGLTSKVSYKHQTCEFSIPLAELPGYSFSFKLKYYGTGGGGPVFAFDHPWRGQAITVDSNGDIYVTGLTESLAFPTTGGVIDTTGDAGGDVYVTKINGDLDTLIFSTYLGGSSTDYGNDIELDSSGNVYVGGVTSSSDFPTTANTYQAAEEVFLTILSSDATSITYSTIIGGDRQDLLGEMKLFGATPLVYMAGKTCGGTGDTNLPTTGGAFSTSFAGAGPNCRGFLSVINPTLTWPSALTYSTYLAGENSQASFLFHEGALGLDVDSTGRAHMAGQTLDTGLATAGAYDTSNNNFGDGYYAIIDPAGGGAGDLDYFTYIGDSFEEARAMDIVLDSNDDAIIVGETNFELDDVTAGFISDYGNFFLVKISPDGSGASDLLYATMLPETDQDNEALSLAIDSSDRVYVVGKADEIQTTPNAMIESANDNDDPWFAIIDPSGNGQQDLIYSTYLSDGSSNDFAQDVVLDSNNRVYFTGTTFSGDFLGSFPFANSVYDDTFNGDRDVFIGSFATSFTTTPGGGAPPPSPGIQRFPTLGTPLIGPVEVLSDSEVKFNWTYTGDTPQSFSLLDPQGIAAVENIPGSERDVVEEGLPHNTSIEGRKVAAYLSGAQKVSQEFPPAVTHMPSVSPLLASRNGMLTIAVEQQLNNLDLGQSGLQFESMTLNNEVQGTAVQQSEWIQETEYTFEDYDPTTDTQVRVRARNQDGVETEWSQYILIPGEEEEEEAAEVSLGISMTATTAGGAPIPRPIDPNSIIFVNISVSNGGPDIAANVFMNLPVPEFMTFVPGSLRVSGEIQTDSPDEDLGQGSRGSVSVIWPELAPDNPQNVSFQLGFDVEQLRGLEDVEEDRQAIAAANPVLVLIASVNSENSPNPVFTPPVELEPEVAAVTPPPPPLPPTPPTPTPAPTPAPPTPPAAPGPPPEELFLTSQVQSEDEMLEFTGTTSEPNSTVTVTLNNILTLQVTSDENGVWQTFVSASQLGIEPGETADVQVDSIAEKDGVISNGVSSIVTVTRGIAGEVVAEVPEPVVSQSAFEQVAEVVEESKEEIQTSLAVAAPIAIASSAPLLGYIPYLPTLLYHFFTWLIGLFRKKEEREIFGTVYDSITKEPLKLAIVRVFNMETGKLVGTEVTNNQGKYDFLLEPGRYRLEVKKPQYNFPSKIVRRGPDAEYQNIYVTDEGFTVTQEEVGVPDVPVDPINAEAVFRVSGFLKKGLLTLQKVGSHLALPVLLVGSAISAFTTAIVQSDPINWLLVVVYIFMLGLQLVFRSKPERAWGVVYEAVSNEPLPLATLQLIDPQFGKVVKSRLSDYQGRYSFAPEPGKYVLKAAKPGFEQVEVVEEARKGRQPISGELQVEKPEQRITGDIAMRQSGQA